MPTEIYVAHPGVGINKSSDGAVLKVIVGTNFSFSEQQFPKDAGLDHVSHIQGMVVPPGLAASGNVTFRLILRQVDAGTGNALFELYYRTITPPNNRDSVALTAMSAPNPGVVVAMPMVIGNEVEALFTVPIASFVSGRELLLQVKRVSTHVSDTYGGKVGWVRLVTEFPLLASGGGSGGHSIYEVPIIQMTGFTNTFSLPNYTPGSLAVYRNGVQELPSTLTEIPPNQVQLSVTPANTERLIIWYIPA